MEAMMVRVEVLVQVEAKSGMADELAAQMRKGT
jgi:hypothetical protein